MVAKWNRHDTVQIFRLHVEENVGSIAHHLVDIWSLQGTLNIGKLRHCGFRGDFKDDKNVKQRG
jgi:hypothetical protein